MLTSATQTMWLMHGTGEISHVLWWRRWSSHSRNNVSCLRIARYRQVVVWLKMSEQLVWSNTFENLLHPQLSDAGLRGAAFDNYCNFPKPTIWRSHPPNAVIGHLCAWKNASWVWTTLLHNPTALYRATELILSCVCMVTLLNDFVTEES